MSFLNVVNAARSAANTVNPTGKFHNGRIVDFSQESITDTFPAICLYPFTISSPSDGGFLDSSDVMLGFFRQDRPDTSMTEREAIIQEMDNLALAFIAALKYQFKQFDPRSVRREPVYQFFNGTVSGVLVRFTYLTFADDCVAHTGFGEETLTADAQTVEIIFDAKPGARYVVTEATVPDWITLPADPFVNGIEYTIGVDINMEEEREAIILFTSVDDPQVLSLTITQAEVEI